MNDAEKPSGLETLQVQTETGAPAAVVVPAAAAGVPAATADAPHAAVAAPSAAANAPPVNTGAPSPAESAEHFPREGLTMAAIRAFAAESGCAAADAVSLAGGGAGLTTSEVCARFVVPATADTGASYCAGLVAYGSPHVGYANVFVSHVWAYRFLDVVAALESWAGDREPAPFFWFDIFTNSQHNTGARPFSWWTQVFRQNVGAIGRTVLVTDYGMRPARRAWCVWELASTLTERARLEVAALPSFAARLRKEQGFLATFVCDVERAEAFLPGDRASILAAIEHTVGFTATNNAIAGAFTAWMGRAMLGLLAELPAGERGTSELLLRTVSVVLSDYYLDSGSLEYEDAFSTAVALLHEAVEARTRAFGPSSEQAKDALNQLLFSAKRVNAHALVEATARRILSLHPDSPDSPTVQLDLATALHAQGGGGGVDSARRAAEALEIFEKHAALCEEELAAACEDRSEDEDESAESGAVGSDEARADSDKEAGGADEEGSFSGSGSGSEDERERERECQREALVRRLDGALVPIVELHTLAGRYEAAQAARVRRSAGASTRAASILPHVHALVVGQAMPCDGTRIFVSRLGNCASCSACGATDISTAFIAVCAECERHMECVPCSRRGL